MGYFNIVTIGFKPIPTMLESSGMLTNIKIKNYRNIKSLDVTLAPKGNILIAPNGSGKTNFLESIYFSIFGQSFKPVSSISEFIGPESNLTKIEFLYNNNKIETLVNQINGKTIKRSYLNAKVVPIKKIYERYSAIIFAPHSVNLVSSDPSFRRKDLDDFLSSVNPIYANALSRYSKVLKNRNALLKAIGDNNHRRKELEFWTQELVKNAAILSESRVRFFEEIGEFIIDAGKTIFKEHLSFLIKFAPNMEYSENYVQNLENKFKDNIEKEIIVGKTLYGPHKDDYEFFYDQRDLKFFGSRGQQRIGAFLLKVAQKNYYTDRTGNTPLILIDDIFSELDNTHKKNISGFLIDLSTQFILTSSVKSEVPEELIKSSRVISTTK